MRLLSQRFPVFIHWVRSPVVPTKRPSTGAGPQRRRRRWFPRRKYALGNRCDSPEATTAYFAPAELTVEPGVSPWRAWVSSGDTDWYLHEIDLSVLRAQLPRIPSASPEEPISRFPVIVEGRIAKSGDVNSYPVTVTAGQSADSRSPFRYLRGSILPLRSRNNQEAGSTRSVPESAWHSTMSLCIFPACPMMHVWFTVHKAGQLSASQIRAFSGQGGPD